MQNNYHFLRILCPILSQKLAGAVVSECYTQEKYECILRFEAGTKSHYVRVNLSPSFTCFSVPDDFHRARKNSTDLFQQIIGETVANFHEVPYDRSIVLNLSNGLVVLFKLHSNRANIILLKDNRAIELFRKKLVQDENITPQSLERKVEWDESSLSAGTVSPQKLFFTFGRVIWLYLRAQGFESATPAVQWQQIDHLLSYLKRPSYFITEVEMQLTFSLVEIGKVFRQFGDPITAVNEFHQRYAQRSVFDAQRTSLHNTIRKKIQSTENYIIKTRSRLESIRSEDNFRIWADLIMANMHDMRTGESHVTLPNFYNHNLPVEIKLRRDLSPQKNAEIFYTKSKKQQLEENHLTSALQHKEQFLLDAEIAQQEITTIGDLKALKTIASKYEWTSDDDDEEPLPYHEHLHKGFRIFVGRNAAANDRMLQRHSYKEDLWLHARDVVGSHVLIKYQSGKPFPRDVIERAAALAAYNSKRRTDTLCPVMVTPRKFVRKRKGDPAGAVVVEREKVLMVEPKG